jgi:hypothetical protein
MEPPVLITSLIKIRQLVHNYDTHTQGHDDTICLSLRKKEKQLQMKFKARLKPRLIIGLYNDAFYLRQKGPGDDNEL